MNLNFLGLFKEAEASIGALTLYTYMYIYQKYQSASWIPRSSVSIWFEDHAFRGLFARTGWRAMERAKREKHGSLRPKATAVPLLRLRSY